MSEPTLASVATGSKLCWELGVALLKVKRKVGNLFKAFAKMNSPWKNGLIA